MEAHKQEQLRSVLGVMPKRPAPKFAVLETAKVSTGTRYKIEYLSEEAYAPLHEPEDRIRAYLFVPAHTAGAKLPAILAIHQDGPQMTIGKLETAGLAGDKNLHYGLELFERGYVVLCPDRFYHAERRRGLGLENLDADRDLSLFNHRVGQLFLKGRNAIGKDAFDCMVALDILCSLSYVDSSRVGAIGHSASGMTLPHFMYLDTRVRAGVSSCGLFNMMHFFDEHAPKRNLAVVSQPGLALVGDSADYLAGISPRAILLTRGLWEWGQGPDEMDASRAHVQDTKDMIAKAQTTYRSVGAANHLQPLFFDEGGGGHDFPPGVRLQAYNWLDKHMKES